jgi:competence protein ComEC
MNSVIEWVAQQEAFVLKDLSFDSFQLLLSYGIIICLLSAVKRANFKRLAAVFVSIIAFQLYTFYTSYQASKKEALLLAHRSKNSILLHQSEYQLQIFTSDSASSIAIAKDYQVAERIEKVNFKKLKNSYLWRGKKILVLDSLGIYPSENIDYLILRQSPKINLERLIDSIQPKSIIADGSNYRSYLVRWKNTCT